MHSTPRRSNMERSNLVYAHRRRDEMDLIDMMNKLQNKLSGKGKLLEVSLPQIVVEGGQSAGKSSVLESIIGREFLPRGSGTVTRRPTVIQLQPCNEVYAEFLHKGDEKFTDFERVKQEISDETMRDPGATGFSSKPITLKIFAPNVLKLTFVDMPGIIKNVTSEITQDCIEDVENMILRYIGQPNCIILAVSPANQDIATSDALEMANRVDPKRERTLCVLTKLDLMDRGTDACDILENRTLPLARGYVGVLNRSQEDINEGKDIEYSLKKEQRFFENNPAYMHMADRMGSTYLQKRLQMELVDHIRKTLPSVRKELSQQLGSLRKEVKVMDEMMGFNKGSSGAEIYMHKLVHRFIDDIRTQLFGHSEAVSMKDLKAGAIINFKMYSNLEEILKLPTNLTDDQFMYLIANQHGTRNILSVPSVALESACYAILEDYKSPLENFIESVTDILISAVEESSNRIIEYPSLKAEMIRYINESIDNASEETKDLLGKHLDAQMKYCNIYHWDFSSSLWENGLVCSPVKVWNSGKPEEENEPEIVEGEKSNISCELNAFSDFVSVKMKKNKNAQDNSKNLSGIVKEYLQFVQKQVADTTIKYINCFLVIRVFDFIKTELMVQLLNSSNKDSVLSECELEFQRRNDVLDMCTDLEEALVAVQSF